ncbi:hypothetical protein KVR01_002176 [Diaporthe batatas]|uniref:uncharacterized protein n=1 Tax=Diaporthe batatas TaxID=748121 RepID=UPI001D05495E|nr:uncharacterized protein KVR01_002176 [Diaporthe batatas]KAG8166487.1 hypothetical protein KVR01_002176 [Diaporthe batatas]
MSLALDKTPQTSAMSLALEKAFVDKTPQTRASSKPPRPTEPTACTEKSKARSGPGFMDLPYNIRKRIRHEALLVDTDRGKPFLTSNLATVAKEWRDDIEEVIFNDITIDALDDPEVLAFKAMFATDRRRQLLTRLNFAVDDSETGPWYKENDGLEIAQIVDSIGDFLKYIHRWDFRKEGGGRRPLEIAFATSQFPDAKIDWSHGHRLIPNTTSMWEHSRDRTAFGVMELCQLSSIFHKESKLPPFLDKVTYLSIPPDCIPHMMAQEVIEMMPNLETLILDPRFDVESDEPWVRLLYLIDSLPSSVPSLQNLTLRNTAHVPDRDTKTRSPHRPECMALFSAVLRDNSQGLRSLCANPFEVDEEFIRPFSRLKHHVYRNTWRWPRLQHIDLQFFEYWDEWDDRPWKTEECQAALDKHEDKVKQLLDDYGPIEPRCGMDETCLSFRHEMSSYLNICRPDPEEPILSPTHILIAAGRATTAMPVLESAHISIFSQARGTPGIFAKRKLCPKSGNTTSSRVWLCDDFHPKVRAHIMEAWADFLGPDPKVDAGLPSEFTQVQRCSRPTG